MTPADPIAAAIAPPPPPAGAEGARALVEWQLQTLTRLAEMGMMVAEDAARRAVAGGADPKEAPQEGARPDPQGDPVLAYSRASRAVRMAIALQSRLLEGLAKLEARARLDAIDRKTRVRRIVERVVEGSHENEIVARRLAREAHARLERDDIYGVIADLPVSEVIARICKELGLAPDWGRLADEAWAQAEMGGGAPGAPLAAWMARYPDRLRPGRPPPAVAGSRVMGPGSMAAPSMAPSAASP